MVPEEYRVINRAICLLPNEYQDEREAARTALHALYRKEVKMGNLADYVYGSAEDRAKRLQQEIKQLRADLESCRRILTEARNREGENSDEAERLRAELARAKLESEEFASLYREKVERLDGWTKLLMQEKLDMAEEVERLGEETAHLRGELDEAFAEIERLRAEEAE